MRALKKLPPQLPQLMSEIQTTFFPENVFILNLLFWEMVGIGSLSAGKSKISTMQWGYDWGGREGLEVDLSNLVGWVGVEGYARGSAGSG